MSLTEMSIDELRAKLSDITADIERMQERQKDVAQELVTRTATVGRGDIVENPTYLKGRFIILRVDAARDGGPIYILANIKKDGTVGERTHRHVVCGWEKPLRAVAHNLELLEPFEQ